MAFFCCHKPLIFIANTLIFICAYFGYLHLFRSYKVRFVASLLLVSYFVLFQTETVFLYLDYLDVCMANALKHTESVGEVEMLVDGRGGVEVEVFEVGDGEAEVDELVVGGIEARENGVVVVNPVLGVVVDFEECRPGTADGDIFVQHKELDGGVCLQLLPDGFVRRGGEKEGGVLDLHYLEHAGLWTVIADGGQYAFGVFTEEIDCLLYHYYDCLN